MALQFSQPLPCILSLSNTWINVLPGRRTRAVLQKQPLYVISHILYNLFYKVKKIIWHDLKDHGNNQSYKEHNFGLVRNKTLEPKPAYRAIKAFYGLIPLKKEKGKRTGKCEIAYDTHLIGVYGLLISRSREKKAVIWTDRKDRMSVLRIPFRKNMEFFNMHGNPKKRVTREGPFYILNLREKDGPVYIRK